MTDITLNVNGTPHRVSVQDSELLLDALRRRIGVTSAREGCGVGACGACTVLVDGVSAKSCSLLGVQVDGAEVTTIEGLATNGELHPVQQAFHDHHALQCGYCTPGMVMAAVSLIEEGGATSEPAIREGLEGNLCRCTGYHNIVAAVASAAGAMGRAS
jgi:aerobic carbon-monoxide dehydrogenase small subunit